MNGVNQKYYLKFSSNKANSVPLFWLCSTFLLFPLAASNKTDFYRYKGVESAKNTQEYLQNNNVNNTQNSTNEISSGLKSVANKFSFKLKQITEVELGVSRIQEFVRSAEHNDDEELDDVGPKHVKKLSRKLEAKILGYVTIINKTVASIVHYTNKNDGHLFITDNPCVLKSENSTIEYVSSDSKCEVLSRMNFATLNLTHGFIKNVNNCPGMRLQYFISNQNGEEYSQVFTYNSEPFLNTSKPIDKCFTLDDPYFQKIFVNTVMNKPKQIVLMVDHGSALSQNQISNAKSLSKYIISSLSSEDKVGLLGLAETVTFPDSIDCMASANDKNKAILLNFINSLTRFKGTTNHSLGFQSAFNMIKHSVKEENEHVIIIYISRGLLSSLTDVTVVMEAISDGQDSVLPNVIINTCLLIDDGKILFEKHFLMYVSQQNFTNYNIENKKSKTKGVTTGVMELVNSSVHFPFIVRRLLGVCSKHPVQREPMFSLPHWDVIKRGELVVTISQPALDNKNNFLGIIGVEASFEDLFEDFLYFDDYRNTRTFVIDYKGHVLLHPALKVPNYDNYEQPAIVDIGYLEFEAGISEARHFILSNSSGVFHDTKSQVVYRWQHLISARYIVVVISNSQLMRSYPIPDIAVQLDMSQADFNMDLSSADEFTLCWNLKKLNSLDTGSLFLSAWCFQSPYKYLTTALNNESYVLSYMAYLKDNTKLLANPGLKSDLRSDVTPMFQIFPYWKKLFYHSSLHKYIVRRYIATRSGAVIIYPGAMIDPKFDPLKRLWYVEAMQHPDKVILTTPYLDSGGAGYIVTISQSLNNPPTAVVAMDVTIGYIYKLLSENISFCSLPEVFSNYNTKCFIMDDRGYLITHPGLIGKEMLEKQHITHMESLLANDMLNHKGFVQKLVCNDYISSTIQRHYKFNMNGNGIISNMIPGDQCVRYHVIPLHGTNIFLGIINTTCDLVTAFCPCNTVDRHCLNCGRLEQSECECPCECPLETCGKVKPVLNPPCFNYADPPALKKVKTCHQFSCEQYLTYSSCIGIIGCEWCQIQSDTITPVKEPFCTQQEFCFNSVLGSSTHSSDSTRRALNADGVPVTTLGGAVIVLLLALALMFHCYMKHNQTGHQYLVADTSINLLNIDRGPSKILEEPPTGANNGLVSSIQEVSMLNPVAIAISPYRLNTGYSRPPTSDSDHGYSTMTPHEDTEPPESQLLPSPNPNPHQTLLPNHILAPVTVHMVMDT